MIFNCYAAMGGRAKANNMWAYYNENDPATAEWLRELIKAGAISDGEVDERSIEDVLPTDVMGFRRVHCFSGIAIWDYALNRAGWDSEGTVWTGSCPCQPFSAAGKGDGFADERHLWPAWFHLIEVCRPDRIFGEQVCSKDGLVWLDLVVDDLAGIGYTVGAIDIPSASVGGWDRRQRLYFTAELADTSNRRRQRLAVEKSTGTQPQTLREEEQRVESRSFGTTQSDQLGDTLDPRSQGHGGNERDGHQPGRIGEIETRPTAATSESRLYADTEWIYCRDGKYRPIAVVPKFESSFLTSFAKATPNLGSLCDSCMAQFEKQKEEKINEHANQTNANQALSELWEINDSQTYANKQSLGGSPALQYAEILQQGVLRKRSQRDKDTIRAERATGSGEIPQDELRGLRPEWKGHATLRSSQGREPNEQCTCELTDVVRQLSSAIPFAELQREPERATELLALLKAVSEDRSLQYTSDEIQAAWRSVVDQDMDALTGLCVNASRIITIADLGFVCVPSLRDPAIEKTVIWPLIEKGKARMMRLRGYGNSLNGDLATEFIKVVMETAR